MIELLFLVFVIFGVTCFVFLKSKVVSDRDNTEVRVERELERVLSRRGYIVFGDLIIPSVSDTIASTQIDHVIISVYGVFCLETKSHQGNIYGNSKSKYWKQYLGNKSFNLYNPLRQNYHHVKSLEYLLRSRLKSQIHSYVVFPTARKVKISGHEIDFSIEHTIDRILRHQNQIYSVADVEAMARGLAFVTSKSGEFRDRHIESVKEYITSTDK